MTRTTFNQRLAVMLGAMLITASAVSSAGAGPDPADACAAAKQKAAAQKFSGKVKCHGTALKKGEPVDAACLTKAEGKFDGAFAKAEAKGGCATTGDADDIELLIDNALTDLLAALPGAGATTTTTMPPASCDTLPDCQSCGTCAQEVGAPCEDEVAACLNDTDCAALNDCFSTCPDQACIDACLVAHPTGAVLYSLATDCILATCPTTCGP